MIRTNKFLGNLSDWRKVSTFMALCCAVALIAVEMFEPELGLPATVEAWLLGLFVIGMVGALRLQQKLSKHNSQLDVALNNMIQGLCMFDAQNRLVVWNQRSPSRRQVTVASKRSNSRPWPSITTCVPHQTPIWSSKRPMRNPPLSCVRVMLLLLRE